MEATVLRRLRDVIDPETGVSMLALGVIQSVRVAPPNVHIVVDGTHALSRHFAAEAEAAAREAVPVGWGVEVHLSV